VLTCDQLRNRRRALGTEERSLAVEVHRCSVNETPSRMNSRFVNTVSGDAVAAGRNFNIL
jgi:hypothetical protein